MALITDLWCDGDTNEKLWKTKGRKHIGPTYFADNNTLTGQGIKIVFDLMPTQNDEDRVKVALLYLLASGLLNNSPRVHLSRFYVDLIDDLESFNKYPWGNFYGMRRANRFDYKLEMKLRRRRE
ncbi:hypothetical protein TorRG33x02_008830 [Trema orientale]|uniref:DUF1985 domain-containing protein n=1 Tax=Trema orientale TaxID=63057 RepID=A0A2P5G0U0_TREOI|nr:hypothetical protein TorRG33x02_008830 [Trema orientale]